VKVEAKAYEGDDDVMIGEVTYDEVKVIAYRATNGTLIVEIDGPGPVKVYRNDAPIYGRRL
jgi:hypothetical protein